MLDVGRKKPISKIRKIAVEQADRRMYESFAIDKVGKDAWFEPIEELIGRPKFVCDRGGRRHKSSLIEMACGLKVNGKQAADYFSLGQDESRKKGYSEYAVGSPRPHTGPPLGPLACRIGAGNQKAWTSPPLESVISPIALDPQSVEYLTALRQSICARVITIN